MEETDSHWTVAPNAFNFSNTITIDSDKIKGTEASPISPMPMGLVNRLNEKELKDLLAYLLGKPSESN
jgi:hypothetical protein